MVYSYNYSLSIKLKLSDGAFNFLTIAIKRNKITKPSMFEGEFWNSCIIKRRQGDKEIILSIEQMNKLLIAALEPLKKDYQLNQESREFAIDLCNTFKEISADAIKELNVLNDDNLVYSTKMEFI
ncbi:hypothetical protein [Pedobacter nutrimenti]|uniref:Uncharacterized protein n=1 Tax=Pedobacter nutrimenti TaxID=1241337 RepID=A0A318U9C1_9SPHI|nr:hypothetical protein [Pedobacter nutrimenti]PYF68476.1 hypothetical protein B0O44_11263 [Pedobacter nutrimenti]